VAARLADGAGGGGRRGGGDERLWDAATGDRPYALVLLDARMPDTDGLALAAEIRKRAELSATRIILLSSGDRPGDWDRFRALRIDAHREVIGLNRLVDGALDADAVREAAMIALNRFVSPQP
jgi:CheY-like chemotaxis protein